MNNYMKTIISGLKQWVSSQKSDWNQNDSSAANFIKNRPFYSEEKEKVFFSGNVTTEDMNGDGSFLLGQVSNSELPLTIGQEYLVKFNNEEFVCKAFAFYDVGYALGNSSLDDSTSENTGEPFLIVVFPSSTQILTSTLGTHSLSISSTVEEVHQIDSKYIPMPKLADVAISGDYYDLQNTPYIPWDTVQYATSQSLPDNNKQIARSNIGAIDETSVNELIDPSLAIEETKIEGSYWDDICYGSSTFVAVSNASSGKFKVAHSGTGETWEIISDLPSISASSTVYIAYGNSVFVTNQGLYSSDRGETWNTYTRPFGDVETRIFFCGDYFILSKRDGGNIIYYSSDAISWTEAVTPMSARWVDACYGKEEYLLIGLSLNVTSASGCRAKTSDFINWNFNDDTYPALDKCVFKNDIYVATHHQVNALYGSKYIYYSTDGLKWTSVSTPEEYDCVDFICTDDKFLISSYLPYRDTDGYLYSFDGKVWFYTKESTIGRALAYGAGKIIDFGLSGTTGTQYSNTYAYSCDGISWGNKNVVWRGKKVTSKIAESVSPYLTSHLNDITARMMDVLNSEATTTTAGLMSAADKTKVNGIATNLVNGSAPNSLRSVSATSEDASYSLGQCAFATGSSTKASGNNSHAEGLVTTASGLGSHAEGANTTASGYYSHAEGYAASASGYYSHAEGENTIAASGNQHVQGKYNVADSAQKYAHIVGNGESHIARSNAHTLDWDGVGWYKGDLKVGGTGQDDETAKSVLLTPTEEETLEMLTEMELVDPVGEEGFIYTDENGVMYTLI